MPGTVRTAGPRADRCFHSLVTHRRPQIPQETKPASYRVAASGPCNLTGREHMHPRALGHPGLVPPFLPSMSGPCKAVCHTPLPVLLVACTGTHIPYSLHTIFRPRHTHRRACEAVPGAQRMLGALQGPGSQAHGAEGWKGEGRTMEQEVHVGSTAVLAGGMAE